MLHFYYGREKHDKEGFLYERIGAALAQMKAGDGPARVVLLVPDQYTLQAERIAPARLGTKGLIDLEIVSFGRLVHKVLSETGGASRIPIDKYGRHMLLSAILAEESDSLTVFRGMERYPSFIEMTESLLSEMKQYNTDIPRLLAVIEAQEENTMLRRKLTDIYRIYQRYEEKIAGKYTDSEDMVRLFLTQLPESAYAGDAAFWVYGFESFSPQKISVLAALERISRGVSVIVPAAFSEREQSLFAPPLKMKEKLRDAVGEDRFREEAIERESPATAPAIAHIEQELFAHPFREYKGETSAITLCRAANYYAEIESAAAFLIELVREKGLRYRDIAVICNDPEARGMVIRRVFSEYGIRFFIDEKRSILHNPVVSYITSLLDIVVEGWRFEDVFLFLKTDFTELLQEEYEALESYAVRYRIRGNRWKKEFRYGKKEYGEEELARLNTLRQRFAEPVGAFEEAFRAAGTVGEKTAALLSYLTETAALPTRIEAFAETLTEDAEYEAALECAQIWESTTGLFAQFAELMGERTISGTDYRAILTSGFASLELGLIPPTVDQVVVGDMQRIMTGPIKALIVIGANDGVLPADTGKDDLLSRDERALLLDRKIEICKEDDLAAMQERLAIYKNFSKPSDYLWVGYSTADPDGKELRPSVIFTKLTKLFPDLVVKKDLFNREDPLALIEQPAAAMKHLTAALLSRENEADGPPPPWQAAFNWYRKHGKDRLALAIQGFSFQNDREKLDPHHVETLFTREDFNGRKELVLSPSRVEKFSRCPFAHLVLYGLKPEEERVFEVAGREVGDVYHECLMRLARQLSVPGLPITAENSPWMTLAEDECRGMIGTAVEQISAEYREGVLLSGQEERYRAERMKEICAGAAWALVSHVREGHIRKIYFEETFGAAPGNTFPAVTVETPDRRVRIEGKIDRVDVLSDNYVKIIDYKSGKEHFNITEAKGGWRLQLMLYLRAAMDGLARTDGDAKPAGVFYFEIADPLVDITAVPSSEITEKIQKDLSKMFRLDGVTLNDEKVVAGIAGEFSGYSDILPLYRNKEGELRGTTDEKLLSAEDFNALENAVDDTVRKLCGELAAGVVQARPKKAGKETACDYCQYKSICNFELSFDGCAYDVVI